MKIVAFDVLYVNGKKMLDSTLEERKTILAGIKYDHSSVLEVIEYHKINFGSPDRKKQLEIFYNNARGKYNEGLMIKENHKNAIYMPGTRKLWYKLKSFSDANLDTLDLILVGAYKGEVT